jgi:hypothetical protein
MTRDSAAKDEIFLPALDLFSLLLFSFIGLAFMVRNDTAAIAELELPIVDVGRSHVGARSASALEDVVFLSWEGERDKVAKAGESCHVELRSRSITAPPVVVDAPCWPDAFATKQKSERSQRLLAEADRGARAMIVCPPATTSIEACGRLQWVAHEHHFRTAAAITPAKAGAR